MLALVLTSLLASHEVVVTGGVEASPAMLGSFGPQAQVTDGSEVYRALFVTGPSGQQPFDSFTAAAPKGWPASLVSTWDGAMTLCRRGLEAERYTCAASIQGPLWQRYLDDFKPGHVTVIVAKFGKVDSMLEGTRFEMRSAKATRLSVKVTAENAQLEAEKLLKRLLMGEGDASTRVVPGPVPNVAPIPRSIQVQGLGDGGGVVELQQCAALPGELQFETRTPVTVELERRWKASVKSGPTVKCTLEERFAMRGVSVKSFEVSTLTARCGSARASTEAASLKEPPRADAYLNPMLQALALAYCP